VGAEQVITSEVEVSEQNSRLRECFDVAVQNMASLFPVGKMIHENLEAL